MPEVSDLSEARREIDRIDAELVKLLVRRLDAVVAVAAAKRTSGKPVNDPKREREILSRIGAEVPPEYESAAHLLFSTLFAVSKRRQREIFGASEGDAPKDWKVAVVGLGLIGGSFEKAARKTGYEVVGLHHGDATGVEGADLVLVCLPPEAVVPWIRLHCASFAKGAIVVDIAGVKGGIMSDMAKIAKDGWTFVGGHPMAGREVSGYENSLADLFVGASMVLVPEEGEKSPERLKAFFRSIGFERVIETTAAKHDELIAYTSQLCHVIATAYARDSLLPETTGFTAGSFADMTRIATQNPAIWSELFMSNRHALLDSLDGFIARLGEFRTALERSDGAAIAGIIESGAEAKRGETCSDRT